jgi:hypothetical protein
MSARIVIKARWIKCKGNGSYRCVPEVCGMMSPNLLDLASRGRLWAVCKGAHLVRVGKLERVLDKY